MFVCSAVVKGLKTEDFKIEISISKFNIEISGEPQSVCLFCSNPSVYINMFIFVCAAGKKNMVQRHQVLALLTARAITWDHSK